MGGRNRKKKTVAQRLWVLGWGFSLWVDIDKKKIDLRGNYGGLEDENNGRKNKKNTPSMLSNLLQLFLLFVVLIALKIKNLYWHSNTKNVGK